MRYFCIMTGPRGCYMPDDSYAIAVNTRRELKAHLSEAYDFATDYCDADGRCPPLRRREIASVAAALWRRRHTDRDSYLSNVIPTAEGYGIQVNPISRAEYLEAQEESE